MTEQAKLRRKLYELDFTIYELVLFLDSHPESARALELMREYREKRDAVMAEYREKFGDLIITANDAPAEGNWKWIDGPWPWDNDFTEG